MPESGPIAADKAQQLQARAPETAGSDSEFLPPGAMGILELQRKAGNRAVTAAIRAGGMWSAPGAGPMPMLQLMPAVQRWAGNRAATALRAGMGTVQREPAGGKPSVASDPGRLAHTIMHRVSKAVRIAHSNHRHVKPEQADGLIAIIDAYTKMSSETELRFLFTEPDDLYELLAPWGFVGRSIKVGPGGRLADDQAVDSLLESIAAWKADGPQARSKRRAKMRDSFGYWHREVSLAEMAKDDQTLEAGPSRDAPGEPWVDTHEGTRGNRRLERQDIKNRRALDMMGSIKNQGPGGFLGMVVGGAVGLLPGMDSQKSMEAGMQAGAMFDAALMTLAQSGDFKGMGGGTPDRYTEASHTAKAEAQPPMPTPGLTGGGGARRGGGGARGGAGGSAGGRPGDTQAGQAALGPAGEGAKPVKMGVGAAGSAGEGARPREGVGYLDEVSPGAVISAFKRNPNYVRKSASDDWHRRVWIWELSHSGKWDFQKGPAPEPPMAFHLKNGMMQVNELAWFQQRGSINEILRPHERVRARGGGAGGGQPGGGAQGGSGGTQVGFEGGPGGAPGSPRSGKTQVGVPLGPGGTAPGTGAGTGPGAHKPTPLKVPEGPPPVAPGNDVRPATPDEAKALFKRAPHLVQLAGDRGDFHQYLWELKNWHDGKRVTSKAPTAFWMGGQIRVHGDSWLGEGRKLEEVMKPYAPAKRQPKPLEVADTQAGAPGGRTNVSIGPGPR